MVFYEQVKSLAKQNKVTIEFVVGKAGLSLASYNAYRRHENFPRANEALLIAQALGTTVEYLITGKEIGGLSQEERDLITKYKNLSGDNQHIVQVLINSMLPNEGKKSVSA